MPNKKKSNYECYMCNELGTTDEHVPPKCLFPEKQYLRNNLIVVKSCENHNNHKSKDDEFLRTLLVYNINSNSIAKELFYGKTIRAVKRKTIAYRNFFTPLEKQFHQSEVAQRIDRNRFDNCIDHIIRGLFYYLYGEKLTLPLLIHCCLFGSKTPKGNFYNESKWIDYAELIKSYVINEPIQGENPQVFKFRFRYDKDEQMIGCVAQFYESTEVYVLGSKDLDKN